MEDVDEALGLRFRRFGVEVDQFLVLLRRAQPAEPNAIRSATNLGRTLNIGAYDGTQLVGAIRVLTDGRFAHIAEVLVDPDYASTGLESALRERATRWVG
jgi:GNAT superfamily N-acetyltransferase